MRYLIRLLFFLIAGALLFKAGILYGTAVARTENVATLAERVNKNTGEEYTVYMLRNCLIENSRKGGTYGK